MSSLNIKREYFIELAIIKTMCVKRVFNKPSCNIYVMGTGRIVVHNNGMVQPSKLSDSDMSHLNKLHDFYDALEEE